MVDLHLNLPDVVTHHDCLNNELIALTNRHLVDKLPAPDWIRIHPDRVEFLRPDEEVVPGWTQEDVMLLRQQVARDWINGRRVDPLTYADVIMQFTGTKRRALHRAHHSNDWNLPRGRVEAFIKVDQYDEESATIKPPRMIQFRGPAYNLELARWLTPAEEVLLHGPGLGPTGLPSSSKGMTPEERGRNLIDKRYHFLNPVAICMDYSAFDSTIFRHVLEQEWDVWRAMCNGLNEGLIKAQFRNYCCTKNGIRYNSAGTRMSGDRNTGGGNSVTNVLNFYTICRIAGVEAEFICDGDDSVAWMEAGDVPRFLAVAEPVVSRVFGMILRDCQVVGDPSEEYYCQHKNVLTSAGISIPTRDPVRILTRLPWTTKGVRGFEAADLLLSKCIGEMTVSRHITPLARYLQRIARDLRDMGADLRSTSAQEHLREVFHREGVVPTLDILDETIEDDPIATQECERVFNLPSGFLSGLLENGYEFHSSIKGIRKAKAKVPTVEPIPCPTCSMAFVSR